MTTKRKVKWSEGWDIVQAGGEVNVPVDTSRGWRLEDGVVKVAEGRTSLAQTREGWAALDQEDFDDTLEVVREPTEATAPTATPRRIPKGYFELPKTEVSHAEVFRCANINRVVSVTEDEDYEGGCTIFLATGESCETPHAYDYVLDLMAAAE